MFTIKPLSPDAIDAALDKAVRYRLLNEPMEAESICLDVLEVDPRNEQALVTLLLSLTDQFQHELAPTVRRARELLSRLEDPYSRVYYEGIICERQAKAHLRRGGPGGGFLAYDWFRQAMELYERAEELSPPGNDDAVLRWNACARIIMQHGEVEPARTEPSGPAFLE